MNKSIEVVDICELPNGYHLYRKPNEAGGYTYYSDEIGAGVTIWDTCLVDESTLLAAMVEEHRRVLAEKLNVKKQKQILKINRRLI